MANLRLGCGIAFVMCECDRTSTIAFPVRGSQDWATCDDELADVRNALRLLTRGFLCVSADEAAWPVVDLLGMVHSTYGLACS